MPDPPRPAGSAAGGAQTCDAVVWDLGGVLIGWDPRRLYSELLPEHEIEPFLAEIGFAEWNHAQDAGRPFSEGVAELSARFPHRAELIAAYPDRYDRALTGAIEPAVQALAELRQRAQVRLLALTNWSAETFHHAESRYAFLTWFEGILVSGREGVAKPDPRIFALLADRFRLDPARTVFLDDAAANVAAAQAAGWRAFRVTDPGSPRRALSSLGLLG
jgi:2-haloacid dehalogenase